VAITSDARMIAAVQGLNKSGSPGYIFFSRDSGSNYHRQDNASTADWSEITFSCPGDSSLSYGYLTVVQHATSSALPGLIYSARYDETLPTETNLFWNEEKSAGSGYWGVVDSSYVFSKPPFVMEIFLRAAVQYMDSTGLPGHIFLSYDGGDWLRQDQAGRGFWNSVAVSKTPSGESGCRPIQNFPPVIRCNFIGIATQGKDSSGGGDGCMYRYIESGTSTTWERQDSAGRGYWAAVASSVAQLEKDTLKPYVVHAAVQHMDASGSPGSLFVAYDFFEDSGQSLRWNRQTFRRAYWVGVAASLVAIMATDNQTSTVYATSGQLPEEPPIGVALFGGAAATGIAVSTGVGIGE